MEDQSNVFLYTEEIPNKTEAEIQAYLEKVDNEILPARDCSGLTIIFLSRPMIKGTSVDMFTVQYSFSCTAALDNLDFLHYDEVMSK